MPKLKNPRWEAFAGKRALGCSLSKAYAEAYGSPEKRMHSAHGSRLAQKPEVAQRIEELRPRSEVKTSGDVDPEFVMEQLRGIIGTIRDIADGRGLIHSL